MGDHGIGVRGDDDPSAKRAVRSGHFERSKSRLTYEWALVTIAWRSASRGAAMESAITKCAAPETPHFRCRLGPAARARVTLCARVRSDFESARRKELVVHRLHISVLVEKGFPVVRG